MIKTESEISGAATDVTIGDTGVGNRTLTEMSLEELWQLFPIVLTEHKDIWSEWYDEESAMLTKMLPEIARISHIGSTAIKGIWAKPTIDILAEISKDKLLTDLEDRIGRCGYICMAESGDRIDFNKGYTLRGFAERVFHLHLRYVGDNDELYFRDYLRTNAAVAKEYEVLKLDLWQRYEHDRDAYTSHKAAFVNYYTERGKRLFAGRYGDKTTPTI